MADGLNGHERTRVVYRFSVQTPTCRCTADRPSLLCGRTEAKVTSVAALQQAHILHPKAGKFPLLRPNELQSTCNPTADKQLTVWEMTHHLLRVYSHEKAGDVATADLLRKLGRNSYLARD